MPTVVRVVEDDPELAILIGRWIDDDLEVKITDRNFHDLLSPSLWEGVDAALVDLMLRGGPIPTSGVQVLEYLREHHPEIRRVVWTAMQWPVLEEGLADVVLLKPAMGSEISQALKGPHE